MGLFALLLSFLALNLVTRRWGVDSRDSRDWADN